MCNNFGINQYLMMAMQGNGLYNFMPQLNLGATPQYQFPLMQFANNFSTMPYYNFTNTSNEGAGAANDSANNNLTTITNYMTSLGFTASNGYAVSQTSDGKLEYTYNKDGKSYTASSLPELMTKMTTGTSPDEKVGSLDDSLTTVKPSNAEEVDDGDNTSREGAGDADDVGVVHEGGYKKEDLTNVKINDKALEWKGFKNCSTYVKNNIKKGMTIDDLVDKMLPNAEDDTKATYKKWVLAANPNGIKDGKVADLNKLDLPVYTDKKATKPVKTTKKNNKRVSPTAIQRKETGAFALIMTKNGSENSIAKLTSETPSNEDGTALLTINQGKLRGTWKFKAPNDDRNSFLKFSDFSNWNGHFRTLDTKALCIVNGDKEYPVKKYGKHGCYTVTIAGKDYPLEDLINS